MSRPAAIWLDAHLSPAVAPWIEATFSIRCRHIRDLGLAASDDGSTIAQARVEGAAIMTKDAEFLTRIEREGAPPHIFLLTCGNTSNAHLMHLLARHFAGALGLVADGTPVVLIASE